MSDSGGTARVLLVEDNAVNRKVAMQMLEKLGCAVSCVEDGDVGVLEWRRGAFDLVFLDCQMARMDGYAAARLIRDEERARGLPRTRIIAMSAYALPEDRQRCLDAGMDDHLAKPLLFNDLRELVSRSLSSGKKRLDPAVMASLKALEADRDPGLIREMTEIFLSLTPDRLDSIRRAIAVRDFDRVERLSHDLKSSCAVLGVSVMAELCAAAERLAREGDVEGVRAQFTGIEIEFAAARELLQETL